jgi:type III secretion system YscQ/HrcQ family protein
MEDGTSFGATTESRSLAGPFPWASLEPVARGDVTAQRAIRRWMAAKAPVDAWAAAARDLVGVNVSVRLDRTTPVAPLAMPGALAVALARAQVSAEPHRGVRIEVDPALAASVLARALGRRAPKAVDAAWGAPESIAGAFAAILVATARRAGQNDALVVNDAGLAASVLAPWRDAHGGGSAAWIAASLTVRVDGESFAARLFVSREAIDTAHAPWSARALEELGPTPLAMPIVACIAECPRAEFSALAPGDVFLAAPWALVPAPGGALRGPVVLAPPGAGTGVRAHFGDDGRLVLSGEIEPLSAAEADMSDAEETGAILSAVGDVPVVIRVEIGEARMPAREWASLRPGDVITVGRRVGEQVVLRVGGVPVARGQLVDVEGEVGVRIDERVAEAGTTA